MNKTVEFYNPMNGLDIDEYLKKEDKQGIHHLGRYHWAKQVLGAYSAKNVLDIACVTGYGSFILASYFNSAKVTGADYDIWGIEIAQETYRRSNLYYLNGNIVTWESESNDLTIPLGKYDAIISFDTISF